MCHAAATRVCLKLKHFSNSPSGICTDSYIHVCIDYSCLSKNIKNTSALNLMLNVNVNIKRKITIMHRHRVV